MSESSNTNLGALTAGVASLFSSIALLTGTGALGRLERNDPDVLIGAVILALVGSGMLVIAGLKITSGVSEIFATIVGTGLVIVGIGWALTGGVKVAGERERPGIQASIGDNRMLDATISTGNLASDKRLAVRIEGVTPAGQVAAVAQYRVGPDTDGKVSLPIKFAVPAAYASVRVKAWTHKYKLCGRYHGSGAAREFRLIGTTPGMSCVVLPLPVTAAADPKPVAPTVKLAWEGGPGTTRRARLTVTSPSVSGKLVVLAAARRAGRTRQLLHAVSSHGSAAAYRSVTRLHVGTRYRRICALAYLEAKAKPRPSRLRSCPLPAALHAGHSGDGLLRPARAK